MNREKDIARHALKYALRKGCQQAKVVLAMGQENELELRDGKVDRLHHSSGCQLNLALFVDGSYSSISTNRLDKKELEAFIDNGIVSTRFLAPDPCRCLPDSSLYYKGIMDDFGLYDENYDDVSVDDKLEVVKKSFAEIDDERVISAAVMLDDNETVNYMVDSNDFEGEAKRSQFAVSSQICVRGLGDERPEDYCYTTSPHWNDLKFDGVSREALRRNLSKIGAERLESGKYDVIVDRWVSSQLLSPLISAMKGEALHQHSSFLINKKGMKIASDRLTVIDNPLQNGKLGSALFDRDGVALKSMPVIENGVLQNYYVSQYMSRKMSFPATTGNTSVLDFQLGDFDTPSLIKQTKKGVFITGFNGGNCNGTTGDFSYGIEGFLIDNGMLVKPVNEMLMTGNMIDLWSKLNLLSNDPLTYSSWNTPSLLFDGVTLN